MPAVEEYTPNNEQVMLATVIDFLGAIGLEVCNTDQVQGSFVPGVHIEKGSLVIDPTCRVSDLLHEAGHLACIPKQFRHLASGDLNECMETMTEHLRTLEVDSPLYRSIIQCSDPEATAWAWAAGKFLGLKSERIIEKDQYDGEGNFIRVCLEMNRYIGIHGLAHAGFCAQNKSIGKLRNMPTYPHLAFWMQL